MSEDRGTKSELRIVAIDEMAEVLVALHWNDTDRSLFNRGAEQLSIAIGKSTMPITHLGRVALLASDSFQLLRNAIQQDKDRERIAIEKGRKIAARKGNRTWGEVYRAEGYPWGRSTRDRKRWTLWVKKIAGEEDEAPCN